MTGLYLVWTALTVYVIVLALMFLSQFLAGKWKSMRVIEMAPLVLGNIPAVGTIETKSS